MKGEGNQQDYGMRIYDPRIGKFLSVDPLTNKFVDLTPCQFSGNRPIDATDLDGAETYLQRLQTALKNSAEMKVMRSDKIKADAQKAALAMWKPREMETIKHNPYTGVNQIGPVSVVESNIQASQQQYVYQLGEAITGGPAGATMYLLSGDAGAFKGAAVDGIMMSFGGIPAEGSRVFPIKAGIQPVRSIANTEARAIRFFGKIDPLVGTTAESIEAAMPNSVLSVERKINNPSTGQPITDYDIELNNYIIEVNDGNGTGKLRQIQHNIQPTTKKEVIFFSPKMGGAVEKGMKANNIQAFRDIKKLLEYITPKK